MLKTPIRSHSILNYFSVVCIIICASGLLIASKNARPIQDDYATLALLSDHGFWGFLKNSWSTHGGNLAPLFLNALLLTPSVNGTNFLLLSLLPFLVFILVSLSVNASYQNLTPDSIQPTKLHLLGFSSLIFLGFESIFTPQFLEATLFSSAVLVHLLPACLFLIAWRLFQAEAPYIRFVLIILGLVSGNCNISESLFIILASIFILNEYRRIESSRRYMGNVLIYLSACMLGSFLIVSAPGFWLRASEKSSEGIPAGFVELAFRFSKSLAIFSGDFLSHPMFYIFIVFGAFLSVHSGKPSVKTNINALYLFVLLFFSLVVGATFAYPAWHQSIGLYVLSPYLGLIIGKWLRSKRLQAIRMEKTVAITLVLIIALMILRSFYMISLRGISWDQNFHQNFCAVKNESYQVLKGTETIYPISNLGIEDLNRWTWMEESFRNWVSKPSFNAPNC
jgi:hypothetical protein